MIKAIETRYKGYRFRSRLEARWAVFFDALGVQWEYEKEGYDLGKLGWYLPDFWLPGLECWVEIKPEYPSEDEMRKCDELAEGTGRAVVIACELPLTTPLLVYCFDDTDGSAGTQWWGETGTKWPKETQPQWAIGNTGLCIASGSDHSSRSFSGPDMTSSFSGMKLERECERQHHTLDCATDAARSARFEHGESPHFGKGSK